MLSCEVFQTTQDRRKKIYLIPCGDKKRTFLPKWKIEFPRVNIVEGSNHRIDLVKRRRVILPYTLFAKNGFRFTNDIEAILKKTALTYFFYMVNADFSWRCLKENAAIYGLATTLN